MNIHIAVIVFISLGIGVSCQDFSSFLLNKNFMENQVSCLMETGSCDVVGSQLKRLLPVILQDKCEHCSPQQKAHIKKLVASIRSRYPAEWKAIRDRYNLKQE